MLIDLHVHSDLSPCSRMPLEDILRQGRAAGLDGVCLTDHGGRLALGLVEEGLQDDGLLVLVGQEYSTRQGDFLLFGDLGHLPADLEATRLLPLVESLGGAAVAAHPFRPGRSLDPVLLEMGLIKLAEGLNGRNPRGYNRPIRQWAGSLGLSLVGGSDAHSLPELGSVATRFEQTVTCQAELVAALKAGQVQPARLLPPVLFSPPCQAAPSASASILH